MLIRQLLPAITVVQSNEDGGHSNDGGGAGLRGTNHLTSEMALAYGAPWAKNFYKYSGILQVSH